MSRADNCAIVLLDLRACRLPMLIHIWRPRASLHLESWAESSRPLQDWGQDSADCSLHTAGPNNSDRNIRLDLLGPAAFVALQEQGE